jgi:alkaline phosphatase D
METRMSRRLETLADRLKRADVPDRDEALRLRRRGFFRALAAGGSVAVAGGVLSACGGGGEDASIEFAHGVASGDPLATSVVLWTRVTPSDTGRAYALEAEVATDPGFATVVQRVAVTARGEADFTAKVDVTGLAPNTRYHYRFTWPEGGTRSPAGRTKTLPAGPVNQVRLAVFSCSNYPAGFFNAYADAAAQADLDAAVHLGDFIYEYSRTGYASQNAAALGRLSDPDAELITLSDYRRRHAQYRRDPDLQALAAAVPMIAVWDDHESANDAWRDGAENHQPGDGDWTLRKSTAIRVWHEWMPTRVGLDPAKTWRRFDFGTLLSLHMLDTRLAGRDRQLDIASYVGAGGSFDGARFVADVGNPSRQLLGVEQTAWLQAQLQGSTATWQVLGQQVLMGRMNIPAPVALQQISVGAYAALVQKAQTAPGTLTPQEQATLAAPSIPYNLDAWDGYAAARETVLGTARALDRNLVVLAGDTHNAWGNDLLDAQGNRCGVEFAAPSVSSPGFEAVFPNEDPLVFAASVEALIGPLQYADTSRRGYLLITATPTECRGDWRFVSTTQSRTHTAVTGRTLRVLPGAGGRALVA